MEEIIKQSFEFAHIKLFKNYSDIQNKTLHHEYDYEAANAEKKIDAFDSCDKFEIQFLVSSKRPEPIYTLRLYEKSNKRKYYYSDSIGPLDILCAQGKQLPHKKIKLVNVKSSSSSTSVDWFETRKDKQIKRHFYNPFATIHLFKYDRWIKKEGDKITMKLFVMDKSRNVNCKYFVKNINSTTVTFNLKTGNFTVVKYEGVRKSKKKGFYCNSFNSLQQALTEIYNASTKYSGSPEGRVEYMKIFDNFDYQVAIRKSLGFDDGVIVNETKMVVPDLMAKWMPKFAEVKKIKLPNDGTRFLFHYYPTEKYLKKNDRKLIASVLDRFGIKSKVTIKLLHLFPSLNLVSLSRICYMFGKDFPKYIGNIHPDLFGRRGLQEEEFYSKNVILDIIKRKDCQFDIRDSERDNLVKIINDYVEAHMSMVGQSHSLVDTLGDHFKMLVKCREYYPELQLNARTYDTFHAEHIFLSTVERHIKKAFSIHCIFDERVVHEIERPIEISAVCLKEAVGVDDPLGIAATFVPYSEVFYPKLLKTSEDYFEEGHYMSHCVGGYIDRDGSIIVSLRNKKERVTSEFDVKSRRNIQSQYFCNQRPPSYYERALITLYERIKSIPGSIAPISKEKIPLVLNGVEVKPEQALFTEILVENRYNEVALPIVNQIFL